MTKNTALQIVTANHLLGGHSVFLGDNGWTADCSQAVVARNAEEVARIEAAAREDEAANIVVGVYLVEVAFDDEGAPEPVHYREKLRARARPSFWEARVKGRPRISAARVTEVRHVSL